MLSNSLANNLKRLRRARGLSQDELAEKVDLSRVGYRNIESGKSEPRVNTLQKIAEVLGVGIQNLLVPIPELKSVRFRSRKSLTEKEVCIREEIVGDIALWLKDFNELEKIIPNKIKYEFENFPKHVNGKSSIEEIAYQARKTLKLNDKEVIHDICGLLESAGIKIYTYNVKANLQKFFGLSVSSSDKGPAIGVNVSESISTERLIFSVAHELGHLLLHPTSFKTSEFTNIDEEENQADEFASFFLMPQKAFLNLWEENKGAHWFDTILHIKRIFKVSYLTVLKRLIEMNKTDNSIYSKFCYIYKNRYRKDLKDHKEPIPLNRIDFMEDRLNLLVREAYEKEKISINRAGEILRISINEMRERANSWI